MTPDLFQWFCVRTDHLAERLADRELCEAGFLVFAPTIWKPAEEMRRYTNGSIRRARPDRVVPMFRRYVFAWINLADPSWYAIPDLPGVERIISSASLAGGPGIPIPVPDHAIAWVRSLLASNGCLYPASHRDSLISVGTPLRLIDGPMPDLTGICQWSDGRRVRLLMQMLGRPVTVTVAQSAVEAIEPT